MPFREALSRLRTAARERFGDGAVVEFAWELDIPWIAERGVTAGDGWRASLKRGEATLLEARGNSAAVCVDVLMLAISTAAT